MDVENAVCKDVADGEYKRGKKACYAQGNAVGIELAGVFARGGYWERPLEKVILKKNTHD